jgi:hypothetical protein
VVVVVAIFLHLTELLVVLVGQVVAAVMVLAQAVLEILQALLRHKGVMGALLTL